MRAMNMLFNLFVTSISLLLRKSVLECLILNENHFHFLVLYCENDSFNSGFPYLLFFDD